MDAGAAAAAEESAAAFPYQADIFTTARAFQPRVMSLRWTGLEKHTGELPSGSCRARDLGQFLSKKEFGRLVIRQERAMERHEPFDKPFQPFALPSA